MYLTLQKNLPIFMKIKRKLQRELMSFNYITKLIQRHVSSHLRGISHLCDFHLGASVLLQLHGYLTHLGGIIYMVLLPKEPPSASWPLNLGT